MDERQKFLLELGRRVRKARKDARISQTEMGRMVGVHRNTIFLCESGNGCSIWMVEQIAASLKLPLRALVPRTQADVGKQAQIQAK